MHRSGLFRLIHPTAVIDPSAELDTGVQVGPYAVIDANVKIGRDSWIGPHAVLRGPTEIGRENRIFQFASIGEDPQDKKYRGERTQLCIGDRNQIREFVTIHRGTVQDQGVTRIGDDNLIMAYCHVAHDCRIGNQVIMANAASLAGHVQIEDWAILGGFTIVHQFCRVGAHSFSAMGSVVAQDIPPFVLISGHPAEAHGINTEGLRRRGFPQETIAQLKQAYRLLYKSGLRLDQAIAAIRQLGDPKAHLLADFLSQSTRGFVR